MNRSIDSDVEIDVAQLRQKLQQTKSSCRAINRLPQEAVSRVITELADLTSRSFDLILKANAKDLERMDPADARYDRLKLTEDRLWDICDNLKKVGHLPSPLDRILEERTVSSGLRLKKISVPIGVVGIIFESRPNVMFDVFALNFKAGNASVLKGGSDAHYSNLQIAALIKETLEKYNLADALFLLPSSREALPHILQAEGLVDLIIPRGSQGLIDFVRKNALVPVIETGAGIVHTYVDISANISQAAAIVHNAKTRRVSVCNALDTLLLHEQLLPQLPLIVQHLADAHVQIRADDLSFEILQETYPSVNLERAKPGDYGTEFLSMKMSIKTVANLNEALDHIDQYSSRHSEAIIADDEATIAQFFQEVDAATVYCNASTAYTDGGEFGLGAEIGISTQKLHARGPMGLAELTSYKWLVTGDGHIRLKS